MDRYKLIGELRRTDAAPIEGKRRQWNLDLENTLIAETTKRGDVTKVEFYIQRRGEKRQLGTWWATYGNGQGTSANSFDAYKKVRDSVINAINNGKLELLTK